MECGYSLNRIICDDLISFTSAIKEERKILYKRRVVWHKGRGLPNQVDDFRISVDTVQIFLEERVTSSSQVTIEFLPLEVSVAAQGLLSVETYTAAFV